MKPYQQRVVDETAELDLKLTKLVEFIKSDKFIKLPPPEIRRLKVQRMAMHSYAKMLRERIEAFE